MFCPILRHFCIGLYVNNNVLMFHISSGYISAVYRGLHCVLPVMHLTVHARCPTGGEGLNFAPLSGLVL